MSKKYFILGITCTILVTPSLGVAESNAESNQESNQELSPLNDFDFLIGEWQGEPTFYFPRILDREPLTRPLTTVCEYTLNQTYIVCNSTSTLSNGTSISLRMYLTYDAKNKGYQTLFIYDRRPLQVRYIMRYNDKTGTYVGFTPFENSQGAGGQERIEWRITSTREEFNWQEFQHYATEDEGYWPRIYNGVMRKVR